MASSSCFLSFSFLEKNPDLPLLVEFNPVDDFILAAVEIVELLSYDLETIDFES